MTNLERSFLFDGFVFCFVFTTRGHRVGFVRLFVLSFFDVEAVIFFLLFDSAIISLVKYFFERPRFALMRNFNRFLACLNVFRTKQWCNLNPTFAFALSFLQFKSDSKSLAISVTSLSTNITFNLPVWNNFTPQSHRTPTVLANLGVNKR